MSTAIVATSQKIEILNGMNYPIEEKMLAACLVKAASYLALGKENETSVEIIISQRIPQDAPAYRHPGWLEYVVNICKDDNLVISVHAIQRKPTMQIEFCS